MTVGTPYYQRRDTAAAWSASGANPILGSGERALETDTRREKVGDGSTRWNALAYVPGAAEIAAAIAPLATTTSLNNAVAPLATTTALNNAVAPLATTTSLNNAVAPLAPKSSPAFTGPATFAGPIGVNGVAAPAKAAAITPIATAATDTPAQVALRTAINALIAVLQNAGFTA